jgi:hypothetical protein
LSILPKLRKEPGVLSSREADHAQLRDHNRPTEDRNDGKKRENELACDRRVIERKKEAACC